ncbi:hypothetical protein HPB50_005949 [Hyalomma asiaticum]|uniref:Uncharacterized protein n=1 Tax=Hyalomma asiaticum TaxID=266040 RepID=A0ACB7RMN2_HYAAI|nr:hypothetical protein HPB50_005949 [Hyalomma asiaticum]
MTSLPIGNSKGDSVDTNFFKPHQFVGDKRLSRRQSRWVLDFCQRVFSREPDETQQFLDVGCGIGDLTRDELLPRCLPCRRIVAVDVNSSYAKLDIASDEAVVEFLDEYGTFDRVYSFHALIWVRDQAKALKNVARLLKPRGECLLVFHASLHALDVNRSLVDMERWSKYRHLVEQVTPKTQDMNDEERREYISGLLAAAGLSPSILELPVCTAFDDYSFEALVDMYVAKSPLCGALSDTEKPQFYKDMADELRKFRSSCADRSRYRLYVIKASKSEKK